MIATYFSAPAFAVLAVVILGYCSCIAGAAPGGDVLDSRGFLEAYRPALERLRSACGSCYLEGVYTGQRFESGNDRPVREVSLEMAYGSDGNREKHVLIRRDSASVPYFERVFLPRNGRTLILERIDPARPFYIRWITRPTEAPDDLRPNDRRDEIVRAAYSIGRVFLLPEMIDWPGFRIIEVRRVNQAGASLVRVAFKCQPDAAKSLPELDGWLLLDPDRDWALREHEVRLTWPASPDYHSLVTGKVRYADGAGSGPLPEEVTLVDRAGTNSQVGERRTHFQARRRISQAPLAQSFTLAAYDLGDYPWDIEGQPEGAGPGQLKVVTPIITFDLPSGKETVDLSFELENSGTTPVRVVGMRFGCAAILPADDLPCRIEAGQTKRLTLKLRSYSETGDTSSPLYVYTTAPGQSEVELTLRGRSNTGNR